MKRNYNESSKFIIKQFYLKQHQSLDLKVGRRLNEVFDKQEKEYTPVNELLEIADTIVDPSDPDTSLSQTEHAYQSAAFALENNEQPWLIASLLIHDLGKCIHSIAGIEMHFLVGDTYPLDVPPEKEKIVYGESVLDLKHRGHQHSCGLSSLTFTGHDEFLWKALLQTEHSLPQHALYCIRFHSFYPYFDKAGYFDYANMYDLEMLPLLKTFNKYDLYSKNDRNVDKETRDKIDDIVTTYLPRGIMFPKIISTPN